MDECISWLAQHKELLPKESVCLDVGAYHGEFTERSFQAGIFSTAWLFEPNPENINILKQTSFKNPVKIINVAVSNMVGHGHLYYNQDLATGSLLPYFESENKKCDNKIIATKVHQITLDYFYKKFSNKQRISLIKIDTQGMDLHVLKGAANLIQKQRPWIVAELIFLPLYHNQSNPIEIINWCTHQNYMIGGFFNDHYSFDGWLSYADIIFIPQEIFKYFQLPFNIRRTPIQESEISILKKICDERLELINYLHSEAEKRMAIINNMKHQLQLNKNK